MRKRVLACSSSTRSSLYEESLGGRSRRVVRLVGAVAANEANGLGLERVQHVAVDVVIGVQEHDGLVPELLLGLVGLEAFKPLRGLPDVDPGEDAVVLIEQVVDATEKQFGEVAGLGQLLAMDDDGDERFPLRAADANTARLVVDELHGHGGKVDYLVPSSPGWVSGALCSTSPIVYVE